MEAIRTLGVGGWGSVHVARVARQSSYPLDRPGATFAVKVVGKASLRDMERNDPTKNRKEAMHRRDAERRALASLPWNPFITGLIDVHVDQKNVFYTMELGPCDTLFTLMRGVPRLTDKEIKFYFSNLVLALEFLHTNGIVHCDVKPENLVLGADGYLMLTDFGLAQPLSTDYEWACLGTTVYMSPEVLTNNMETEEKRIASDWWAAAITLFEMKTLRIPFEGRTVGEMLPKQMSDPLPWPMGQHLDEGLEDIVSRMLHADLPHRYGASDVPEGKNGSLINRELRRHRYMASVNWQRIESRLARAPRVARPLPAETERRHWQPFVEQAKVPGLPLKRPSPRLEYLELKSGSTEREPSRKRRRMGTEFSMCLPPQLQERSPSMAAERGSEVGDT
ncbi:kinase-like domain-containing protein [Trametes polyzona]|nr:kinase-like domain-containing protein [Trametes polyzona]